MHIQTELRAQIGLKDSIAELRGIVGLGYNFVIVSGIDVWTFAPNLDIENLPQSARTGLPKETLQWVPHNEVPEEALIIRRYLPNDPIMLPVDIIQYMIPLKKDNEPTSSVPR